MSRKKKIILAATALLIITLIAVWAFGRQRSVARNVRKATIARGDIVRTVTATGTLNALINVLVGSQVSGRIKEIYVDFNSPVEEGQVIAQIDPALFEVQVKEAEGRVARARANLFQARVTLERQKRLFDQNISSQSELDAAQAAFDIAEAELAQAQAALDHARVNLEYTKIRAPLDGIVISRDVDVGQTVAASLQAPTLFTIAKDLRQMQIDANVDESDIGVVREGQDAAFTVDAFPEKIFHGKVTQVRNAPVQFQNVTTYITVISVDNSELNLKPGMTANVTILIQTKENVLTIPNAALRFRPPLTWETPSERRSRGASVARTGGAGRRTPQSATATVWQIQRGKPVKTTVTLGIHDEHHTEIIEGLKEGDEVVVGLAWQAASSPRRTARNPVTPMRF